MSLSLLESICARRNSLIELNNSGAGIWVLDIGYSIDTLYLVRSNEACRAFRLRQSAGCGSSRFIRFSPASQITVHICRKANNEICKPLRIDFKTHILDELALFTAISLDNLIVKVLSLNYFEAVRNINFLTIGPIKVHL